MQAHNKLNFPDPKSFFPMCPLLDTLILFRSCSRYLINNMKVNDILGRKLLQLKLNGKEGKIMMAEIKAIFPN